MAKTYIYHDGKMWGRTPHTKEQMLALHLPLSTPVIEMGGDGKPVTLGDICGPIGGSLIPTGKPRTSASPSALSIAPAAEPSADAAAAQLAVLRDIASNVRVLVWLALIPWLFALAGLVLWFLAR